MMKLMHAVVAVLAIGLGSVAVAGIDIGPPTGGPIPDGFTARDQTGKQVELSDIVGEKGVVLAFIRSADWCPFCQKQLIDLKSATAPLKQRGYTLAALSYDTPEILTKFAAKQGIDYILLSDEKSAMIDAFGIRDPQYPETSKAYGVPKPGIFVISPDGVIRAKLAEEGYKVRPPVDAVIEAVDGIAAH